MALVTLLFPARFTQLNVATSRAHVKADFAQSVQGSNRQVGHWHESTFSELFLFSYYLHGSGTIQVITV
jgi:hypothetical protein